MKKILLTLLLLSMNTHMAGQTFDIPSRMPGGDKYLHATLSYAVTYTTYNYFKPINGHKRALLYSIGSTIVVGVVKEVYDELYRKGWEYEDMIANGVGITLFSITIK